MNANYSLHAKSFFILCIAFPHTIPVKSLETYIHLLEWVSVSKALTTMAVCDYVFYHSELLFQWLYLFGFPESEEHCHEEIRVNSLICACL